MPKPFEVIEALDDAAATAQAEIETIFANAVRLLRAETTTNQILDALAAGSADPILTGEGWTLFSETVSTIFVPDGPLKRVMEKAFALGIREVPLKGQGINLRPLDKFVRQWLRENGLKKAKQLTAETERAIVGILRRSVHGPLPKVATRIAKAKGFGLTTHQTEAFSSWVDKFIAKTENTASPLYELSPKQIEQKIQREFLRRVKTRGRLIAQTESYDAGNAARRELWNEAARQGKLDVEKYVLQWIARVIGVCPRCLALDRKITEVQGGIFVSDPVAAGTYAGQIIRIARPTVHPRCYCSMRVIRRKDAGLSSGGELAVLNAEIEALAADLASGRPIPLSVALGCSYA